MTNAEAIKNIKSMLAVITPEWAKEALEVAVKSMERDEAVKPVRSFGGYIDCPICNADLSEKHEYCQNCGKHIDWEDEA